MTCECSLPAQYEPEWARAISRAPHLSGEEKTRLIRRLYPRAYGTCSHGTTMIGYASMEHYVMGDW